jgi:ribonuclease D
MTTGLNVNPDNMDLLKYPGQIHLITKDQELAAIAADLSVVKEFGFDTETKPSFKKGEVHKVALLQLATETHAYLIRLHGINQFDVIKNIFENPDVIKVGVAIRDDLKNLQKIFKFEPKNFIELQTLAKARGLQNLGLKGMAEEVLNARLSKGAKLTNWEARELTDQQRMYAATDAWVGLKIFNQIKDGVA